MGGIETTATVATIYLLNFAKYPEVQEKARDEVVAVLGPVGNTIQPEHVDRLRYLNACMKETMRLNPPVLGISRKLQQDTVLSGYLIPAKTTVFLHNLEASRLSEHFSEPDTFSPERWSASEKKCEGWVHNSLASLPFGSGRRSCLGRRIAELKLTTLLAKVSKNAIVDS
ncbi:putative cytochrome P450 49a1 [Amblyomma americanum]